MRFLANIFLIVVVCLCAIPAQSNAQTEESNAQPTAEQTAESSTEPESTQAKLPVTPATSASTDTDTPNKTFELTFDDLKFEMEKGGKFDRSLLTDKINSYDNNIITVRGYIRPSFSQSGLKKFIFVRDNKECCFGPGAALFDCVLVRLAKGTTTDFTVRPITIQGRFSLKEYEGPDGKTWAIYRMNDADVK